MKRVPVSRDGQIPTETSIDVGDVVAFVLESGLEMLTVATASAAGCDDCVFLNMDHRCPGAICIEKDCVFLHAEQLI